MSSRLVALAAALALAGVPSIARAQETADATYVEALRRLQEADFDGSLALLEKARALAADPALLALIFRQRGVIELALGMKAEGLGSFVAALRADASLDYGAVVAGDEARRVFDCARGFAAASIPDVEIEAAVRGEPDPEKWTCPEAPPPPEPVAAPPPAAAEVPPEAPPPLVPPAEVTAREEGMPSWPIWVAAGVSVAAGATGAAFGLSAISNAKAEAETTDPMAFRTAGEAAENGATLATASFALAGTAAATAVALLVWQLVSD